MNMFTSINIIVVLLLIVYNKAQNTTMDPWMMNSTYDSTDYSVTCGSAQQVSPTVVGVLQLAADSQITLSQNVSTWNVSLIIRLINETDPTFLYSSKNMNLLTTNIPYCVIAQFPHDLLLVNGLCIYLPNITKYENCTTGPTDSIFPDDWCIGPLIHSKHPNPAQTKKESEDFGIIIDFTDCGIACKSADLVYGMTQTEQDTIDSFKYVGCTICFIFLMYLMWSLLVDQKNSRKKFTDKSLLHHIPYAITSSLFILVFMMTLTEFTGKESILCDSNPNKGEDREYSFRSPGDSQNVQCTVCGIIFYGALLYYQYYTILLAFVIFRQLYNPMRPFWEIRERWWHIMGFAIVLIFIIGACSASAFGGVWPMGVCLPSGSGGEKEVLLGFVCLPLMISAVAAFGLIGAGSYLLKKQIDSQKMVSNMSSTQRIEDLMIRIVLYACCIEACLILLTITGWQFYGNTDRATKEFRAQIQCELLQYIAPALAVPCVREWHISAFWFISWIICAVLASAAQIFLACHTEARSRLVRAATVGKDIVEELGSQIKKQASTYSHSPHSPKGPTGQKAPKNLNKLEGMSPPLTPLGNSAATFGSAANVAPTTPRDGGTMTVNIERVMSSSDGMTSTEMVGMNSDGATEESSVNVSSVPMTTAYTGLKTQSSHTAVASSSMQVSVEVDNENTQSYE